MSHIWHCKKEPWKQKVIEKTFWWSSIRNTLAHVTVVTHRLSSFIKNAFLPHHPWWSWNMGDDELSSDQSSQRSRLFLESYQVSNEYHRLRSMEIWAYDVTKPVMKMQGNQGRCMLLEMLDSWLLVNRWVFSMLWYAKSSSSCTILIDISLLGDLLLLRGTQWTGFMETLTKTVAVHFLPIIR